MSSLVRPPRCTVLTHIWQRRPPDKAKGRIRGAAWVGPSLASVALDHGPVYFMDSSSSGARGDLRRASGVPAEGLATRGLDL